jgi:enoyl-CoA hydratase/carnithine racemase
LEAFTYELAREMTENAPLSIKGTKFILYNIAKYPVLPGELVEKFDSLRIQSLNSDDVAEAKRAFKEKRRPEFRGH